VGGKEVELVPDRRAGKARHRVDTETRGGPRRLLHLLGGAAADALRLSIPPDALRHGRPVPLVYRVADRLADEVVTYCVVFEIVALKYLALALYVTVVFEGIVHVEVVAPAGELQAIVAHLFGERRKFP
jgi:hypothetical protein